MNSCIYAGRVRHCRTSPAQHSFRYRLFMMYLDLDELPTVFQGRWFWSATGTALARFRRSDHLGPETQPLSEAVRDLVESHSGRRPQGPIRLLTNLAYFGYCFNPVSFYYCFKGDGETVEHIVAEVNNTPWGECDTYVLECDPDKRGWQFRPAKTMHVSPFMPMEIEYEWALSSPGKRLSVFMANARNGERFFEAGMALDRRPINGRSLAAMLCRFPLMTTRIIVAIYWQALRLWLKRVPVYTHPDKQRKQEEVVAG